MFSLKKQTAPTTYDRRLFFSQCQQVISFLLKHDRTLVTDWTLSHLCLQVMSDEAWYLVSSRTIVPNPTTLELVDWASRLDGNHWDRKLHPGLAKDALAAIVLTFPFRPCTIPTEQAVARFSLDSPWIKLQPSISLKPPWQDTILASVCNLTTRFLTAWQSCLHQANSPELSNLYRKKLEGIRLNERYERMLHNEKEDHQVIARFADPAVSAKTKEEWFEAIAAGAVQLDADAAKKPWPYADAAQTILKAFRAVFQILETASPLPDFRPYLATRYEKKSPPPDLPIDMPQGPQAPTAAAPAKVVAVARPAPAAPAPKAGSPPPKATPAKAPEPQPPTAPAKAPEKVVKASKPAAAAPAPKVSSPPAAATPAKAPEPPPTVEVVRFRVRRTLHWPE